ncbi:uncharacterized protein METZ01_LOCUS117976, partial [marine metagenome]
MKLSWTIILGLALLPLWLNAADSASTKAKRNISLTKQKAGQQRIGDSIRRVRSQLDSVVGEYARNGLEGDDVDALKRFRGMLDKLTESEINKILKQLESSTLLKENKANDSVLGAFDGQKGVIAQLNTIYLEWQTEQIFRELSDRFMKLSVVQQRNYRYAVQTAKAHNQIIPTNPSEEFKIDIRVQELDQNGIGDESATLIKKLEQLDKKLSKYIEPRPSMALRLVKTDLKPALAGSVKDIKEYNLSDAAIKERTSYIAMINIARVLAPKRDDEEVIRQALRDVEEAIGDQQELLEDTTALEDSENPNPEELSLDQADLVDRTDFIRQDVADLVPTAAQDLSASTDNQQEARAALSESAASPGSEPAATAAEQQEAALENFAEAKAALEEALESFAESGEGEGEGEGEG